MRDEVELLYKTYATGSGASPGASRLLRACHTGSGRIDIEDLLCPDPSGHLRKPLARLVVLIHSPGSEEMTMAKQVGFWSVDERLAEISAGATRWRR